MKEIIFLVFLLGAEPITNLETILEKFERETKIHIWLETIQWSVGWKR